MSESLLTTVTGGYNGGAVISIKLDNTEVFTATATDTYNRNYNTTSGSFTSAEVGAINILVTPPPTTTSALTIAFSGGISRILSVTPDGANTSYGYNFSDSYTIGDQPQPTPTSLMKIIRFTDGSFIHVPTPQANANIYNVNGASYIAKTLIGWKYTGGTVQKIDENNNVWDFIVSGNDLNLKINNNSVITIDTRTSGIFIDIKDDSHLQVRNPVNIECPEISRDEYSTTGGYCIFVGNALNGQSSSDEYLTFSGMLTRAEHVFSGETNNKYCTVKNVIATGELFNTIQCFAWNTDQTIWTISTKGLVSYLSSYAQGYNDVNYNTTNLPEYNPNVPTPVDPYDPVGDSTTGGGGGSWDGGSDPVGIPNLPSVGATNTGFITLFVPTQSQLKQVAEYLWGGLFDISTYLRLFEDPMDCILGLSVVPVSVPTSGSATITVGNIELSGISLPVASQQYVEVDCGSLTVDPYFGSYLDYEPYTKMSLFVPYSGVHTVNADDIMGRTVNLVYHIDILTGSLVAFLKCGDSVLYEFNGACGSNIPVNSMNYASTIENAIRIAVNIGTTVATAGASAPLSAGTEASKTAQNVARGISLAGSTADGALSLKPNIDRAGSLGGTTGLLGNQIPYFIVTRPRLCKPKNQNKLKGYPAFINYSVSDLVGKGYTEFDTILLKNLYLTDDEKNELESILEGGVYL